MAIEFKRDLYLKTVNNIWTGEPASGSSYEQGGRGMPCTDPLRKTWERIGEILASDHKYTLPSEVGASDDQDPISPKLHLISAATGVGKSTCTRAFAVIHADQTNFLIACRTKNECDDAKRDMDALAKRLSPHLPQRPVISCYHGDDRCASSFVADILVVTHEQLRIAANLPDRHRMLARGIPQYPTPQKADFWNMRDRRWIADESYSFATEKEITLREVQGTVSWLKDAIGHPMVMETMRLTGDDHEVIDAELETLQRAVDRLADWEGGSAGPHLVEKGDETGNCDALCRFLHRPGSMLALNDPDSKREGKDSGSRRRDMLTLLDHVLSINDQWTIRATHGDEVHLYRTEPLLPTRAPILFLMDATAYLSPAWASITKRGDIRVDQHSELLDLNPRTYRNVQIAPMLVARDGTQAMCGEGPQPVIDADFEAMIDRLKPDLADRKLGAIHQYKSRDRTRPAINRWDLDSPPIHGWYGNHDRGTNAFRDCSVMLLAGPHRKPDPLYRSWICGYSPDKEEAFRDGKGLAKRLAEADMAAVCVQAINRSRSRVMTADGDTETCTLAIIVSSRTWEILRPIIQRAMPGVRLRDPSLLPSWHEANKPSPDGKARKRSHSDHEIAVIEQLRGVPDGGSCEINHLFDSLNLRDHTRREIFRGIRNESSRVFRYLKSRGANLSGFGRGRASPTVRMT